MSLSSRYLHQFHVISKSKYILIHTEKIICFICDFQKVLE